MSDYISREAFIADCEGRYCAPCKEQGKDVNGVRCRVCWVDDMLSEVLDAPAADVEPVRCWIPCSERLPEVDDIYLCVYHFPSSNKSRCTTLFFYATDLTPHFQDENYCGIQVTHWLPTPPLPSLGER